jgi:hypothetical protein
MPVMPSNSLSKEIADEHQPYLNKNNIPKE